MDAAQVVQGCRRLTAAIDAYEGTVASRLRVNRNDLRALNLLEDGPRSQTFLAQALGLTKSSVTVLVDRLEAAGLATRRPDPTDRRATLIELAPATWQALADHYGPAGRAVGATASRWTIAQRAAAATALHELANAFENLNRPSP